MAQHRAADAQHLSSFAPAMISVVRRYAFKNRSWRRLACVADWIGDRARRGRLPALAGNDAEKTSCRSDWTKSAILFQTLPVFDALRASYQSTEIHFLTTSQGAALFNGTGVAGQNNRLGLPVAGTRPSPGALVARSLLAFCGRNGTTARSNFAETCV